MAKKTKGASQHPFENVVPQQQRRKEEHGGIEVMTNSQPMESRMNYDGAKSFHVPTPGVYPNEFTYESHTIGKKK
jgi:hypothetical protein